jgi:hypothetical protein
MLSPVKTLLMIVSFQIIISCEKDAIQDNTIIGTWVSEDKIDTLSFINDHVLKKSYHTFYYSRSFNRITVQYSGPCYILVSPSTHHYSLGNNKLTIDFSNGCYGFNSETTTYFRQ